MLVNVRVVAALPLLVAALWLAPRAWAPPEAGILVPGVSLGGAELGMTRAEVSRVWGARHGVCRDCHEPTWYFNLRPFEPQGAGVVFRHDRVAHVFTTWKPIGWRTADGLSLGANQAEVEDAGAVLVTRECAGYTALVATGRAAATVYYVYRDELWGFGLIRPRADPCL
jgi:hypothetical protein